MKDKGYRFGPPRKWPEGLTEAHLDVLERRAVYPALDLMKSIPNISLAEVLRCVYLAGMQDAVDAGNH